MKKILSLLTLTLSLNVFASYDCTVTVPDKLAERSDQTKLMRIMESKGYDVTFRDGGKYLMDWGADGTKGEVNVIALLKNSRGKTVAYNVQTKRALFHSSNGYSGNSFTILGATAQGTLNALFKAVRNLPDCSEL